MRKRLTNQWEGLFSSFWGRSKDVGRIQIKGSQIRVELGELHFCPLLLLVIFPFYFLSFLVIFPFFKNQFIGEINFFIQIILPLTQCVHCMLHFSHDL